MNRVLVKEDQFNTTKFHGKLVVNKPVIHDVNSEVEPYSSIFYWSHSVAMDDCEFGLHPHKGFEILSFVFEGTITHFDTVSNVWTPLHKGDFQVIHTGSGIQHAEKIAKGTRSFQLWFDPDFNEAIKNKPTYQYFHPEDLATTALNDIEIMDYIGGWSSVQIATKGLSIKKISSKYTSKYNLTLDPQSHCACYVLNGNVFVNGLPAKENDVVKITHDTNAVIAFDGVGELFIIQIPLELAYKVIWEL